MGLIHPLKGEVSYEAMACYTQYDYVCPTPLF